MPNKYIESPDILWTHFEGYVLKCKLSPIKKREYVGKDGLEKDTPLPIPITFEGFENYLADEGVIKAGLGDYSANSDNAYTEFIDVIKRIKQNCFVHNFNHAAVGMFSATLIARKLGLIDKSEQTNNVNINQITGMKVE